MFTGELTTSDPAVRLIRPDVERDAPRSVAWLAGQAGRETLDSMGVASAKNHDSTIEVERQRIAGFLTDEQELDWMIEYNGQVVGAIWVHLEPEGGAIEAPAISLMIGDPAARGQGIGRNALQAVLRWLDEEQGSPTVYARHLVTNDASRHLLEEAGFQNIGDPYYDDDGLHWQNVQLTNWGNNQ